MNTSSKKVRFSVIFSLITIAVGLHYGTPHHLMYLHVLLQALFFIPVFLSGWWFGKRGGIVAAAIIFSVYIHHAVTVMMPTAEMAVGNGIQILLFFIAGALTGTYKDMRSNYQQATRGGEGYPPAAFPAEQKLLVYLDDSGAAMNAVRYVAHLFGGVPDAKVMLLKVCEEPRAEVPASNEAQRKKQPEPHISSSTETVEEARALLLESGFPETNIATRIVERKNTRISDILLAEQQSSSYSAIVVSRHRLTRSEEFLFGSVAIRLARQANCPVWVIGGMSASEIAPTE